LEGEGEIELEYEISSKEENGMYETSLYIEQIQEKYKYYEFSLEILFNFENNKSAVYKIRVDEKTVIFKVRTKNKPTSAELDPNGWLLAKINEK
jgi:hypothetical protein